MLNRLKKVFASLENHDVKYVVIGGIAAILHGVPRVTFDLDILIENTEDNARRLLAALLDAGLATAALTTPEELVENEITAFRDYVRVDVQTSTPGLSFKDAWLGKEEVEFHGQVLPIISKQDLIVSKRAAGREVDLRDVRMLEQDSEDGKTS